MLAAKPIRALAQVLIMGAAAWLVLDYGKSPAIIFAATLLFSRALAPVEGAIAGWKSLEAAFDAYRRLTTSWPPSPLSQRTQSFVGTSHGAVSSSTMLA